MADAAPSSPTLAAGGSPSSDLRHERLGRGGLLADWILANASKQKFDLENAILRKTFGGEFSTIPFGNTVLIQGAGAAAETPAHENSAATTPANGWRSKLAPLVLGAALASTGIGGAALAFPALAAHFRGDQPAPPAPGVIEFPVQIDWNFNPHGGNVQPK